MFTAMGAEAFADRVACELRATGERARKRSAETTFQLTPQQAQIGVECRWMNVFQPLSS